MTETDQDAADVARVLAGDASGFEGIVRRWQHRLINLAWRFCRERTLAEDMAQEVFLKAYRSLASFRGDAAFSTWLTAIAVNTYRSRIRAEGQPLTSLDPVRPPADDSDLIRGLVARQRDESVRRAVLTLPARYRDAILLFYFEERSVSEAAQTLSLSEGTLKARLHRARELLRQKCATLGSTESGVIKEK